MSLSRPVFASTEGFSVRPGAGLFPISVVTELTGVGAHTLRGYERAGLLALRAEVEARRRGDR